MNHLQRFVMGLILTVDIAIVLVVGKIVFTVASIVPGLPIILSMAYFYALGYAVEYVYANKLIESVNASVSSKVGEMLRSVLDKINPFKDKK